MKRKQSIESVRWDLALRYRLIETVAWWEGRLTTNHLIQSFGISRQQASKDINSYITDYAPKNLEYDKHLKGYVPSRHFKPLFIDDSASAYLHLLSQNYERAPHIDGLALAYAHTEVLGVPDRSVRPEVLRPLLKACREGLRLECEYVSFTTPEVETRLIAPHTLIYTGMRWHVRAYCEKNRDYRDFVLSRFRGEPDLDGCPLGAHSRARQGLEHPAHGGYRAGLAPQAGAARDHRGRLRHAGWAVGDRDPRCPGAVRAAALSDRPDQGARQSYGAADRRHQPR